MYLLFLSQQHSTVHLKNKVYTFMYLHLFINNIPQARRPT